MSIADSLRPLRAQNLTVTTTLTQSGARVKDGVQCVRLSASVECYVLFGPSGTQVTAVSGMRLAPNYPETFKIAGGDYVVGITSSGSGTLNITEMSA